MKNTLVVPGKKQKISEWDAGSMIHSTAYWKSLRNKAKQNLDTDPIRESFEAGVQDATIREEDRYRFLQDGIKKAMSEARTIADSDLAEKFPYTNLSLVKGILNNDPDVLKKLQMDEDNMTPEDIILLNEESVGGAYQFNRASGLTGRRPRDMRINPQYPQLDDFLKRKTGSTADRILKRRNVGP